MVHKELLVSITSTHNSVIQHQENYPHDSMDNAKIKYQELIKQYDTSKYIIKEDNKYLETTIILRDEIDTLIPSWVYTISIRKIKSLKTIYVTDHIIKT